ncbi:LOW QUALITY PROTEIN: hypothetical protein ACHAW6_015276 [Cyclotella cf. meneghiniana]
MKSLRHGYELQEKKTKKQLLKNLHFISKPSDTNMEPLGNFADKLKNCGLIPTRKYVEHVYKSYHASICPFLTQEVKKEIWTYSCWMCHTKEQSISINIKGMFHGLVTGLNQHSKVRLQFHIYTDCHEQMLASLEGFEKTRKALGFPGIHHVIGGNLRQEAQLFMGPMDTI